MKKLKEKLKDEVFLKKLTWSFAPITFLFVIICIPVVLYKETYEIFFLPGISFCFFLIGWTTVLWTEEETMAEALESYNQYL